MRRAMVLAVLGVFGLGLVACGGEDASPIPSSDAEVREVPVTMRDIAFDRDVASTMRGAPDRCGAETDVSIARSLSRANILSPADLSAPHRGEGDDV